MPKVIRVFNRNVKNDMVKAVFCSDKRNVTIAFNTEDRRVCWGLELDESEERSILLKMTNS